MGFLMKLATKVGFALLIGASTASAAPPAAVPPAGPLPLPARMQFLTRYENSLSHILGREVSVTFLHVYDEQSGDKTMCVKGMADGQRFRLVDAGDKTLGDPSEKQWAEAGCTRPGYQLIH